MRKLLLVAAACLCLPATVSLAQDDKPAFRADYIAGVSQATGRQRSNIPLIGLRRRADYLVFVVSFTSDSRDALVRKNEIHTMLLDALGKSGGAGVELATGNPLLTPLTRENYQDVGFTWAGREDTSKADIMVKVPMGSDPEAAEKRVDAFVRGLTREGRGTIYKSMGRLLAVSNPGQYRSAIVRLIADDARANAEMFGPDYRVAAEGIDESVQWSQVSSTDVFLYLPYSYRVVAQ